MVACAPAHSKKMIQVDESFDGREVVLHSNEMLEVRLSENAATGYRWGMPPDLNANWATTLRETGDTLESPGPTPGKPGTRVLRFEAIQPGKAELVLEYRRSWEDSAKPARSFRLRVKVEAAG
jgi:predicted secreted protein